ncbi:MAG: hypothetical protein HOG34_05325 [Bacteroidetes bacterium]|nr:hypothetical protein [Bacteroidota bacterium]MBT4410405.1 hypothetical protein [Bacteroidota bacterium]MBT7464019.1 hypothetical protein [Bacteroidota bacterium]
MPRKSLWELGRQDNLSTSLQRISNDNTPWDPGFDHQKPLLRKRRKWETGKSLLYFVSSLLRDFLVEARG